MISITLKDGSKKEYKKNISVIDVAKDISEGFARNVIAASFNGIPVEISTKLNNDGSLELYTWEDNEGKKAFWHSSSHVLAQALVVCTICGSIKPIDNWWSFRAHGAPGLWSLTTYACSLWSFRALISE